MTGTFPNDYDLGKSKYYLIGKDMEIDLITGNIVKRDYTCSLLQIWFCQKGIDHKGIISYRCQKILCPNSSIIDIIT